jgi:Putative prokaryotic signal transducing protein
MSEEVFVLKMFSNEIEARMVQEMLQKSGVEAFVFKDDVGGMEPQLQLTAGVRLLVSGVDAERAHHLLETLISH